MVRKREEIVVDKSFDPDTCEFATLQDYKSYNNWARSNKRTVKIPPTEFWPTVKIKFQRFDQPENVLKFRCRNIEIDYQGQLKPGCIYDLPTPVVKFLNRLAVPKYAEVKVEDGSDVKSETRRVGEICRFSCQVIEF